MSYKNIENTDAWLENFGKLIARHRLNRNLSQQALAKEAGVSARTIMRVEDGNSIQLKNLIQIMLVLKLEDSLKQLIPDIPVSPLELARNEGKVKKHAYPRKKNAKSEDGWAWSDDE